MKTLLPAETERECVRWAGNIRLISRNVRIARFIICIMERFRQELIFAGAIKTFSDRYGLGYADKESAINAANSLACPEGK